VLKLKFPTKIDDDSIPDSLFYILTYPYGYYGLPKLYSISRYLPICSIPELARHLSSSSLFYNLTNPNPLFYPVSLSVIKLTYLTPQKVLNNFSISSLVAPYDNPLTLTSYS